MNLMNVDEVDSEHSSRTETYSQVILRAELEEGNTRKDNLTNVIDAKFAKRRNVATRVEMKDGIADGTGAPTKMESRTDRGLKEEEKGRFSRSGMSPS